MILVSEFERFSGFRTFDWKFERSTGNSDYHRNFRMTRFSEFESFSGFRTFDWKFERSTRNSIVLSVVGLSWTQFRSKMGATWLHLGANLGQLEAILAPTLIILKRYWALPGYSTAHREPTSNQLRTSWAHLVQAKPFWDHFA